MSRVVAVAGGTPGMGMTTTVLHIAEALRISGQSTLVIDLDPQGDAAQVLGIPRSRSGILESLLKGDEAPERAGLLVRSVQPGLDLIPGDVTMDEENLERPRGRALKAVIQDLAPTYPWILLDCPPTMGWLTRTACAAADLILFPFSPSRAPSEFPDLGPLKELAESADLWVLPTRSLVDQDFASLRRKGVAEGVTVRGTLIPEDPSVSTARSRGQTVFSNAIEGRAARAYAQLVKEITRHDRQKTR
ncbi:MAG TPA: ParA family protein [Planctomycetes bacterium]|nr:ParA family protein [Planctomycetota bacterium]